LLLALPFLNGTFVPLLPLAPLPWLLILEDPKERSPHLPVAAGGFVFMMLAVCWIGRVGLPVLVFAAAYYATSILIFAWAHGRCRRAHALPASVLAPLLWAATEIARLELYPFGVQWLNLGIPLARHHYIAQVVELFGAPSLTLVVMILAGGLTDLLLKLRTEGRGALREPRRWLGVAAGLSLGAACLLYGAVRLQGVEWKEGPTVALVQGAVPQDARHLTRNVQAVFLRHAQLTRKAELEGVDLVAWSESTLHVVLEGHERWWEAVRSLAQEIRIPVLVGAIGLGRYPEGDQAPTNSAFLVGPGGDVISRWDKRVLVPAGETLLWVDRWPALRRSIGAFLHEHFHFTPYLVPGREARVAEIADGTRVGVMICYDDAVPGPSRELRDAGAEVLLVITNEAWFGETELRQHREIARLRAIETRPPLLRAGNTGSTVAIDPTGRVQDHLQEGLPGVLVVTPRSASMASPPAWIPVAFRWSLLLLGAGLVASTWVPRFREQAAPPPPRRSRGRRRRKGHGRRR